MNNQDKNVAIIYHYLAHYREPIFSEICKENSSVKYTIFSDKISNIKNLVTIDPNKSETTINWEFIVNKWFFNKYLWQKGLITVCLNKKFDSIIFLGNPYFISTWLGVILAKLMGKRVFMWTHGFLRYEKNLIGFIRLIFYRLSDGLFVYGNRAKEILVKKGYNKDRIHVLYNSLDFNKQINNYSNIEISLLSSLKNKYFGNSNLPTILWIGRLVKDKKIELIIHALKRLVENHVHLNLLVIGDGPEKTSLIDLTKKLSLDKRVFFYGPCHDEEILAPLITLSDLCVSPGPVGLTALHSMTYGVPVLTNNNFDKQKPEFEVIKPGITGDFFQENDLDDLCDKIKKWINVVNREQVAKNCQNVIHECWNPAYQKNLLEKVFTGNIGDGDNC